MVKKRKKAKPKVEEIKEVEEILELEQEIKNLDPDSIEQFEKEDKQIISRYIG